MVQRRGDRGLARHAPHHPGRLALLLGPGDRDGAGGSSPTAPLMPADWVDNDPRFAAGAPAPPSPGTWGGQWYDFMDSHGWSAANNRRAKWLGAYRDQMRLFSQSGSRARSTSSA